MKRLVNLTSNWETHKNAPLSSLLSIKTVNDDSNWDSQNDHAELGKFINKKCVVKLKPFLHPEFSNQSPCVVKIHIPFLASYRLHSVVVVSSMGNVTFCDKLSPTAESENAFDVNSAANLTETELNYHRYAPIQNVNECSIIFSSDSSSALLLYKIFINLVQHMWTEVEIQSLRGSISMDTSKCLVKQQNPVVDEDQLYFAQLLAHCEDLLAKLEESQSHSTWSKKAGVLLRGLLLLSQKQQSSSSTSSRKKDSLTTSMHNNVRLTKSSNSSPIRYGEPAAAMPSRSTRVSCVASIPMFGHPDFVVPVNPDMLLEPDKYTDHSWSEYETSPVKSSSSEIETTENGRRMMKRNFRISPIHTSLTAVGRGGFAARHNKSEFFPQLNQDIISTEVSSDNNMGKSTSSQVLTPTACCVQPKPTDVQTPTAVTVAKVNNFVACYGGADCISNRKLLLDLTERVAKLESVMDNKLDTILQYLSAEAAPR